MEVKVYDNEQSQEIRDLIDRLEKHGNAKCFLCKRYSGAKYKDPKRPDIKPKGVTLRKVYYGKCNYNICTDCYKDQRTTRQAIFSELQTQAQIVKAKLEADKQPEKIIRVKYKPTMKEIIIYTLCGISVIATVLIIAFYFCGR